MLSAVPKPLRLAAIDGALLGLFMLSVGVFVPLVSGPGGPIASHLPSPLAQRALIGLAMGLTAVALIYSPLGARSGAHMNPGVTLAFLRLRRISVRDALLYITAQVIGGVAGALLAGVIVGSAFTDEPIRYAPTTPGMAGVAVAAGAEFVISFVLMLTVLYTANSRRSAPYTGVFAGSLLVLYITFESPLSGMSVNPARTLASALPSQTYTALWLYLIVPPAAMLLAAEIFTRCPRLPYVHCCKLNHNSPEVCPYCGCDGPIDFDAHRTERP